MTLIRAVIKYVVLHYFPKSLRTVIKKRHFYNSLKNLNENAEVDFGVLCHLVKPGDNVIDVGANYGIYTKFLSDRVGREGSVFSFEPIPETFDVLKNSVRKLGLDNAKVFNYAISDKDMMTTMEIPVSSGGVEDFYLARVVPGDGDNGDVDKVEFEIECRSLDSFFKNHKSDISFIKCDVEGHELHCVNGAMDLTKRYKPAWLIEISGDLYEPGSNAEKICEAFAKLGYSVYWFNGSKLEKYSSGVESVNYFFLTDGHLEILKDSNFF